MTGAQMLASTPFGTTSVQLRTGNSIDFSCKRHQQSCLAFSLLALQAGGRRFDPGHVHQLIPALSFQLTLQLPAVFQIAVHVRSLACRTKQQPPLSLRVAMQELCNLVRAHTISSRREFASHKRFAGQVELLPSYIDSGNDISGF
jgi:hypothetical protein